MGSAVIPAGIFLGAIASVVLLFISFWQPLSRRLPEIGRPFARELDLADIRIRPEALGYSLLLVTVLVWLAVIEVLRPEPLGGAFLLVAVADLTLYGTRVCLRARVARRLRRFADQLEQVLRLFAGAVRVGLGLRQALIHVADESAEPARRELTRVVGASNVGVPLVDALDGLAARMTLQETAMLARVIRVQSQTGSDLATVLEGVADTIRERRRFLRKVKALTASSNATAWLLGLLPVALGTFIIVTQPAFRHALLFTGIGRIGLSVALILDAAALFVLLRITRMEP